MTCAIYRDAAPGLDVRAFFHEDDLMRSERAAEIGAARDIAGSWKRAGTSILKRRIAPADVSQLFREISGPAPSQSAPE
jgi:hypothetical protein